MDVLEAVENAKNLQHRIQIYTMLEQHLRTFLAVEDEAHSASVLWLEDGGRVSVENISNVLLELQETIGELEEDHRHLLGMEVDDAR